MEKETQSIKPKRFIQYDLFLILSYEEGECGSLQSIKEKSRRQYLYPDVVCKQTIFANLEFPYI